MNLSPQLVIESSAGEKWQTKYNTVLVIQAKQNELLVSKLEEVVKILKKDKVVQKRVSILNNSRFFYRKIA